MSTVVPVDFTLGKKFSLDQMPEVASVIHDGLVKTFTEHKSYKELTVGQVLVVAEEAGEFVGAWRRWDALARRQGSWQELNDEWADVVIAAFCAAKFIGIKPVEALHAKAQKVMTRGYREG